MEHEKRYTLQDLQTFAEFIRSKTDHKPTIGIICGTGLGGLADTVEDSVVIQYSSIPNFPVSTVKGHNSQFVIGKLRGKTVICMQGRFHLYEGYPAWKIVAPVRVMSLLGVETLFVTNAAGGINRSYNVGDVMIIKDHINFTGMAGHNPLTGPNMEEFGPRFPNMSDAYDVNLRKLAHEIAEELGFQTFIREGVYAMLCGPSFETPAELRFLQTGGADAVGMSTCPEVTAGRHCGMRTFGLTLVSNLAILGYDDCNGMPNHEEVLEAGRSREVSVQTLVANMVERIK
ncbi:purine nucleoside phosphorylase-like isoform X2 [Amphiura filiformis]|uniref:purine nucleoside phosphorylase-like isoform X2 n=1 Tax=Amphiura filiformis TaxID=82378 RepID=UPI003B213966